MEKSFHYSKIAGFIFIIIFIFKYLIYFSEINKDTTSLLYSLPIVCEKVTLLIWFGMVIAKIKESSFTALSYIGIIGTICSLTALTIWVSTYNTDGYYMSYAFNIYTFLSTTSNFFYIIAFIWLAICLKTSPKLQVLAICIAIFPFLRTVIYRLLYIYDQYDSDINTVLPHIETVLITTLYVWFLFEFAKLNNTRSKTLAD